MTETLQLKGTLLGHNGWVTQIATNPKYPDMILSSSRGKFDIFFLLLTSTTVFKSEIIPYQGNFLPL